MNQRERNYLVVLLGFIAALGPFSIDTYLPAFSAISKEFHTTEAMVTLTLTSYFVGITLGQLFYGPIMDKYGRKKPLLIGFVIYIISAFASAMSNNIYLLIIGRFTMAIGGCAGLVSSNAIIRDSFDPKEFAKVLSSIVLVMGVAPVIAPTLGSWLLQIASWRGIFIFLGGLTTLLAVLIYFSYEDKSTPDGELSLKVRNVVKGYVQIAKDPSFANYSLARSFSMSVMFAYIATISFILMDIYEVSKTTFGWMFGLNALGFIIGSQFNKVLLRKFHLEKLTLGISIVQISGVLIMLVATFLLDIPLVAFAMFTFLTLFTVGIINPNTTSLALAPFEKNAGAASALIGSLLMGVGAFISALIGKLYDGTIMPLIALFFVLGLVGTLLIYRGNRVEKSI